MNVSCSFIIYFLGITIITCTATSPGTFDNNESLRNYQYSLQATKKGGIVVGAHNSNYSVIISYPSIGEEDISSKIIRVQPQITKLSPTIGLAYVGITADCTYLKNKMFEEISNSNYIFGTPPIGKRLVTSIATRIHRQTLETHLRPFGVNLCIACVDEHAGPQVFEVDGLGSFHSCRMTCLGPLAEEIMSSLRERILLSHSAATTDATTTNTYSNHNNSPEIVASESSLSSILYKMSVDRLVSCILHSLSDALNEADSDGKADLSFERATVAVVGRHVPFHILDSGVLESLTQKLNTKRAEKEKDNDEEDIFPLERYLQAWG